MFSSRIKQAREQRGITQKMLAIKLGIAQTTVSGWENGAKRPSVDTIVRLSQILGVTTDYLLEVSDVPLAATAINTPYVAVSHFEKSVLEMFRSADKTTQANICLLLGVEHPAIARDKAKKA